MTGPIWVPEETVIAMHAVMLVEFGGSPGVRDEGLLDSALARARNLSSYGDPTIFDLAAAYAYGIVRNHPFVDGNKRTGFMVAYTFLRLNGYQLRAEEVEAVAVIRDLAAGDIDEGVLARWIEASAVSI